MLDKIIAFSIKNKFIIGLMSLALIITGVWSAIHLPIDVVPDISNNQVQVITLAPSLGAQEVEQFITAPIELATGNIDHVTEKRSISRSGLSVITIVFKDKTDVYWARQQVNEKLKDVQSQIPKGMGEPLLAPITTGLGEIYHYVVHTKPGYEEKYSATDLRTIQDWVIKRQMAGVHGLAEVSGWGGYVKQYEIALDNEKLNAMNLTISEIFEALENNNQNTGGSYIEQQDNAYFIRGMGQVKSIEDIERIVVKTIDGLPVLVRDVATVQFGSATRYGAITRNGEGEAVAGITLMLKGENFNEVSKNVKERIAQIQKTLPEGVVIEPFIDRSELVGRAMGTVEKNLLEGGLIVIFILVLLLGNLRAGLVVASVIPLAMLFALCMMRLFGVSGNLMSLGAIDFGLIVDGAVIIVEAIVHRITMSHHNYAGIKKLSREQMDNEVYAAASKIRTSAAFGEIIIMIVYLPILALAGIEGKMFIPMAQTVAFAILGAFILSLTYVPMMSALCLSRNTEHKRNVSDRLMDFFQRIYTPVLTIALRFKKSVVLFFFALFLFSMWVFSNMGGEFIPTLEEGDLTVEIAMMQGASLTKVVETFSHAEKILKEKFPEIRQIVTRIGSAEIPTDPMPIERGDMMVQMKPKDEWTSAETREEMQEAMEEALTIIPGIRVEVTQPMQMRFNELMTGIRQDVAIKIFGDDLDELARQANIVGALIAPVNGVTEPTIEKSTGLPQILVEYNRDKIAQYGLTISDVNTVLSTAFAGNVAGVVFEGEMRFDMVVRFKRDLREDIINIENLFIPLPSGSKVPLSQLADIKIVDAPAQVSREDGKRRVFVGFNVRGRDVESLVEEIQTILDKNLKLPSGYYITYGGQFQNLKEANQRLSISVPLALGLILLLLFFTFNSFSQTLLIFTAIPLSAIGGVFALWLRDMPFSISAGVGFIALFGVAVLNGIVLIGEFNFLKKEGIEDIYERVRQGTKHRLRPVIMTAAVAAFGFFPMAFSTSAGAEVQKPLATVVIGGLLSATLLTLIVLPALYILFSSKRKVKGSVASVVLLIALFSFNNVNAQSPTPKQFSVDDAINTALKNNLEMQSRQLNVQSSVTLKKSVFELPKTNINFQFGQYNSINQDKAFQINQSIPFPTYYSAKSNLYKAELQGSQFQQQATANEIKAQAQYWFYQLQYLQNAKKQLQSLDSLYNDFVSASALRYKTGETNLLEKTTAETKRGQLSLLLQQNQTDYTTAYNSLKTLMNASEEFTIDNTGNFQPLVLSNALDTSMIANNAALRVLYQQAVIAEHNKKVETASTLPDFNVGYFNQSLIGVHTVNGADVYFDGSKRFTGFNIGISIPLTFFSNASKIKSLDYKTQALQKEADNGKLILQTQLQNAFQQYNQNLSQYDYYKSTALPNAEIIISTAKVGFKSGDIGYIEYLQALQTATDVQLNYLQSIIQINQSIININFIINK
jgi:cobalt-zinc-cadmium resistance protein CzcA